MQADWYASSLLMPRNLLIAAWRERFGNTNPRILKRKNRFSFLEGANGEIATAFRAFDQQRDDEALNDFVRPFTEKFLVSMVSTRIRLERIGLLHREVPRQRSFNTAV